MRIEEYPGYIFRPDNKEDKARRELETNQHMSEQLKRNNADLQAELAELNRRREEITTSILDNGREIRSYAARSEKLSQFIALAEEI